MGKRQKTGGRQKGSKNKATLEREIAAHERLEKLKLEGASPLEFMLARMRDESASPIERLDAAKAAAPYVHPKLASIEHKGDADNPIPIFVYDADKDV